MHGSAVGADAAYACCSTRQQTSRFRSWMTTGMSTVNKAHTGLWSESVTSMTALYSLLRTYKSRSGYQAEADLMEE